MYTVLSIFLSAALLLIVILLLIYRTAFYSPDGAAGNIYDIPDNAQYGPYRDHMRSLIADLDARPYEEVYITSRDGLRLFGRYYHCRDGAPLDIAMHGYRGTAIRDMCGGIRISYKLNHNILLVDQRSQGKSTGRTITFGILERQDCKAWVEYARMRFGADVPILLYGVSMGAATVLMASELDLGNNVYGIIADCPYSSPKEIIKKVCKDRKYAPDLAYPLVSLAARIFGCFNLEEVTAAEAVQRSGIPAIILHGADDRFVPAEMSKTIADARSDIERYTFPGAGHGMSNIVDTERYDALVLDFICRHCPETGK